MRNAAQRELAHRLLAAIGAVEWVTDEALMDAVTAVSGSGPAYVFLLAEALAQAGAAAGLPPELWRQSSRARPSPVQANCCIARRSTPRRLRQNVTSPGGTTAAALDVLMGRDGLDVADDQGHRRRDQALARPGGLDRRLNSRLGTAGLRA